MRYGRKSNIALPAVEPFPIVLGGGLDETTPTMQLPPGYCRAALNFDCPIFGGYRRIGGNERYSGKAKPSAATYLMLAATSITGGAVGNTLTGATSGATGYIIAITATHFVLTKTVGTFQAENVNVGAGTIGVSTGAGSVGAAATPLLNAQYKNLAADVYRALIAAIPGEGNILGLNLYNDVLYGFRNAVGGATAAMYKSSSTGWTLVALGREIAFTSGGTYTMAEGDVITGATSGATATLTRVALRTGTYAGGDAAGYLFFASQTGTFQAENLNVGANLNVATIAGNSAAITLLPGGRYEFVNANFTGSTDTKRMYGCDGVNKAFEFDGTTFVKIYTGMTTDTPNHIAFHLYKLFLSFNASVQFSATGAPYQWSAVLGAAELAMGDNVTGFAVQPAGTTAAALAIFTSGKLSILYGTTSSNFVLLPYKDDIGAFPYTMQNMAQTMFLDSQGITDIATSQSFGNFSHATLSNKFKTTLTSWMGAAIASSIRRDLSQYRIFFTNGYGLYITMIGRKVIGIMPVLFPNIVRCAAHGIMSDRTEVNFYGDSTGMVYELDKGTSFDGADIEAYIKLAYNFFGAQRLLKRYRDGSLEISGSGYASINIGYLLGYGSTDIIQPNGETVVSSFSGSVWDAAGAVWDQGVWDGTTLTPSTFEMDGDAENVSISITSTGDFYEPYTVTGGVMHVTPRRELR